MLKDLCENVYVCEMIYSKEGEFLRFGDKRAIQDGHKRYRYNFPATEQDTQRDVHLVIHGPRPDWLEGATKTY